MVEGKWWTPRRVFESGLSDNPLCDLCGAIGDLPHRLVARPARDEHRTAECPKWLSDVASKRPQDPPFAAGAPARPNAPPPPPWIEYNIEPPPTDGAIVTGSVYTDGALRGLLPCTRRVGWAFVVVNQLDETWGRFGTVSERYTTVCRAELHAAVEALRHSTPPITIHTDNQ